MNSKKTRTGAPICSTRWRLWRRRRLLTATSNGFARLRTVISISWGSASPTAVRLEALDFVADHLRRFEDLRDREDLDIALRFGLATGPVATGVLDNGSLTFGAWGLPVRQASVLAAMSDSNEVLIDASTAAAAGDNHDLERTDELIALDAEPMDLYTFSTN